ncbi:MAG: L-alanine exporter AlaE [Candidatus Bathyarchaeia archaeon]
MIWLKVSSGLGRRFLVDAIATAIFWTVVYTPIFLYTSKSLQGALVGLGSAALVEGILGGPYGKFLDWFRHKLSS